MTKYNFIQYMKVLLAAGVFYPDVGGPAIHVAKIADRLSKEGFAPVVVSYGDDPENKAFSFRIKRISRRYPKILQWIFYFWTVFKESLNSQVIYAFDPTAAGIPACVASYILGKPFIIRIGGDPIWEREAELGRRVMPIVNYYDQGLYIQDKPTLFKIIKSILKHAETVVFYNQFWKGFYNKYFDLPLEKIKIVKNPVFRREKASSKLDDNPQIIFAGRFVTYKNLPLVLRAFNKVREKLGKGKLLLIGKGPEIDKLLELKKSLSFGQSIEFIESLPQEKLFEKVRESALAIGPALSEFNPNFILEALSFGKPVLLSKGHGLSVDLPNKFIFDPLDQKDFEDKLEYLLKQENYSEAVGEINEIDMSQTWEKVLDFHFNLVKETVRNNSNQSIFKKNILLRYLIAGFTGAGTQIGLLYVFTDIVGFWYIYSSLLAFIAAIMVSFTLQKFWTFADKEIKKVHHQFVRYLVVAILGIFINTICMYLLVDILGLWYIFAQIITGGVIAVFNFAMYKIFIFNRRIS